ncbi:beta-N-acetylhexosaminidase [Aestuariibaculum lutulentum]|uniref:Family 20 glycosylhydrolase n=1 Tax=Aestuariibaculum lutulentum TaxID=2920935 RepID=A0ABS9RG77_9FLAO|nr:family 20 glycosylhydrolase [Aestuariibaculum lutulentum]MCH4551948.1 family 20 glycosylhydrolase [Aestuariibaculum lutulentum]
MNRLLAILCLITLNCFSQSNLKETYNLMPWPKSIEENNQRFVIDENLTVSIDGDSPKRVQHAVTSFLRRLSNRSGVFINEGFAMPLSENKQASIQISYKESAKLIIEDDESYQLDVQSNKVSLVANTDVGAIRGLETLLQLLTNTNSEYYLPGVSISDAPRFVWRGLMIDVSRHFHPIDVIKRNLDAMASVKMNVFHWHLTDDQGFRIESKTYPKLHELASDGLYYTQEQIKDIVEYASILGIRVIPEFDVPGHATAILTAYPELGSKPGATYKIERYSGVFDPTLDPTNEDVYVFLENLFTEIAPLFPDSYFHIGGDENEGKHWDANEHIQLFKKEHNLATNHDLQTYFNIRLEKILKKLDKKLVGWDEIMTPNMPKTAIIHSWRGEHEGLAKGGTLIEAAKKGYNTILSNGFYIDRMESVVKHYQTEPIGDVQLTEDERNRILGGEVTMWSELVTPLTIDSRIWPRTAAIAERLWSQKDITDVDKMLKRLEVINYRLEEVGITHIRNKGVILRNLSNNQDISGLEILSNVCEPLKIYSRNEGGTEYKTYSPFTLFADACNVDANDALKFKKAVTNYTESPNEAHKSDIITLLESWAKNHKAFQKIDKSPKIAPLESLSFNLSESAKFLLKLSQKEKLSKNDIKSFKSRIETLKQPFADVELVIVNDMEKLFEALK